MKSNRAFSRVVRLESFREFFTGIRVFSSSSSSLSSFLNSELDPSRLDSLLEFLNETSDFNFSLRSSRFLTLEASRISRE